MDFFYQYLTQPTALQLVQGALDGVQAYVGKEQLSYTKTDMTLVIASSGEKLEVKNLDERIKGQEELIRILWFVTKTNPQFDPRAIAYAAAKGMAGIDSHSSFITPDVHRELTDESKRLFPAIGVEITIKNGVLTVVFPRENSPASKGGILPEDQIIMIDGRPTKGLSLLESVKLLRGQQGTPVTITIMREGFVNPQDFNLIREVTPFVNVRHELLEKRYGYIRIGSLGEKTDAEIERSLELLEKESNRNIKGIILDLRNNPGGLFDQATKIADHFLESGLIVSLEGRKELQKTKYLAHKQGTFPCYPLVVMVNQGTRAGSEIIAAALQDHRRALILGNQTFGNGKIRTIIPFRDGSALYLTTAVWRTPLGYQIEGKGISPDFYLVSEKVLTSAPLNRLAIVVDSTEKDVFLRIAVEILKRTHSGSFEDLMAAAKEVCDIEQRKKEDLDLGPSLSAAMWEYKRKSDVRLGNMK